MDLPDWAVPIQDLTTEEILYGARSTKFRYELYTHDSATGVDALVGSLDGVKAGGLMRWVSGVPVKKSVTLTVVDLAESEPGKLRISDVNRVTIRVRPVMVIEGLLEIPLSMYVVTGAHEVWSDTGREFELELHDKSAVLNEDLMDETFTADTATPVLEIVRSVVASAGETIAVDGSDTRTLTSEMVWPVGTPKLTIVNELLYDVLDYNTLWVDGEGNFRATPYVRPAARSIRYTVLNDETGERLMRELTDGARSIYSPDWARDRDTYRVPNKVTAVQQGMVDGPPLTGTATNENADSDLSYEARGGRWISSPPLMVEVPDFSGEPDPDAAAVAFLVEKARRSLIASSSVQAAVSVECLPIPLELLDAIRFASAPAGIDARHTVRSVSFPLRFDGLMSLELQEVVDL